MTGLRVSKQEHSTLVEVIRGRCTLIGRNRLKNVTPNEVVVVIKCESQGVFVCRVQGMQYEVCIKENQERIGIFDPVLATCRSGGDRKVRAGYPNIERH